MALGGVNSNPQDSLDTFLLWSEPTGFSGSYGNMVASFGTSWLVNLASYQPHSVYLDPQITALAAGTYLIGRLVGGGKIHSLFANLTFPVNKAPSPIGFWYARRRRRSMYYVQ